MRIIENTKTWDMIICAINKVVQQDTVVKKDEKEIQNKCHSLAFYKHIEDTESTEISKQQLLEMEREGKIFGMSILYRVKRYFYILSKMQDFDCHRQLQLLTNLLSYLERDLYYEVTEDIIEQLMIYGRMFPDFLFEMDQDLLDRMIESAKFLQGYNINIKIEYGSFSCDDEMLQRVFDLIEQKIYSIGGNYVLEKVYDEFFNQYIEVFDLYDIRRNVKSKRNEPANLLLNLSVKHLHITNRQCDLNLRQSKVEEIFRISQAWLDVLDIQSDSGMEYSMMAVEHFPLYFTNEIVFDKMCIPKQYSKKYILLLLEHLIKPFFSKAERIYSYKEYYRIAEYLMALSTPCLLLDIEEIHKKTRVAKYKIKRILNDISRPIKDVNIKFNSLDGETNFYTRPLIKFMFDKFLYIDYHFTGIGFYLAAYDMVKANFDLLDRMLGPLVEEMLRAEVCEKGYSLCSGKYSTQDDQSDCDLVIQSPNRICFFEIKKAEIENEFNRLDDVAALGQLSKGMIKAQKQAFRHKKNLLKNGNLILKSNQTKYEISHLNNENIYLFSICLPEYSFLTSKSFSSKLLEVIFIGDFSTVDPNRQSEVKELNEMGKTILKYAKEICKDTPLDAHSLSFYSAFVSAQQFLVALWCSNSQEEFSEIIRNWIYCVDESLNLYHSILLDIKVVPLSRPRFGNYA